MKEFGTKLLERRDLTHNSKAFVFEVPEDFSFTPGQFVMLWSEDIRDENDRPIKRAFSIASSPDMENKIELCIKVSSEYGLSKRIQDAKIGDEFTIKGPSGRFGPHENDGEDYVMIAAGSGIAPMMSIIRNTDYDKNVGTHYLFYMNKTAEDQIYIDELEKISNDYLKFKLITFITRDGDAEAKYNERVSMEHVLKHVKTPEKKSFFLCGPLQMIKDFNTVLMEKGVPKELIHKESWNT